MAEAQAAYSDASRETREDPEKARLQPWHPDNAFTSSGECSHPFVDMLGLCRFCTVAVDD